MTDRTDRENLTDHGVRRAPDPAAGTTHDPNSVTTGTEVEPTRDVFPPKGETATDS